MISARRFEWEAKQVVDFNANMLVPWVLICSYAYYQLSRPLVSDELYDEWCRRLSRVWWRVKHRHKHLIDRGPTTCHVLLKEDEYPGMVIGACLELLQRIVGRTQHGRQSDHPRLRRL